MLGAYRTKLKTVLKRMKEALGLISRVRMITKVSPLGGE